MDFNVIANAGNSIDNALNKVLGEGSSKNVIEMDHSAINLKGTIVGTLGSVSSTKAYMRNFARYNNYLTSNYGAAQMAADRYMSLKERVPMSFEYYKTPEKKAEVVLYINPEKLTISTQKVIGKAFARGGIYYNHYGDDHWTMTLHGTVGWSQMRGIEALEEVYHNSGTLLKWQNVNADTVHTNNMGVYKSVQDKLNDLKNSNSPISQYFGRVMGTVTDALGMTGDGSNSLTTKLFGKTASDKANGNLFQAITNSVGSAEEGLLKGLGAKNMSGAGNFAQAAITHPEVFAEVGAGITSIFGATTASDITDAIKGDIISSITGGSAGTESLADVMGNLSNNMTDSISSILSLLNGDVEGATSTSLPSTATAGNYYTLSKICVGELNNIVKSAQNVTKSNTINKSEAARKWSDIRDVLTDPYRPRQVFVYYDDRVYIGHFSSFNWNRDAKTHLLIYYDLKFTVTRQVILTKEKKTKTPSLGQALLGAAVGGLVNSIGGRVAKSSSDGGSETEKQAEKQMENWENGYDD